MTKLLKAYPNDLGLVIKLLPFKGQTSAKAAQYSLTLWQQDPARFLALYDKVMSKQGMLTEADINKALAATGMQPGQLIAQAFSGIAERAGSIGQFNMSPELLQSLMGVASAGRRAA